MANVSRTDPICRDVTKSPMAVALSPDHQYQIPRVGGYQRKSRY